VADVAQAEKTGTTSQVETRNLTGGEALLQSLKRQGVDTLFALPGVQLDGFFAALYDDRASFRVVHPRHEQATAYMADGFARATGREGVCVVVPGPGLLNASAALSTAYSVNSPVLCVTGQIRSDMIGVGRGLLHEIPNQLQMIGSVTKHAARAVSPDAIPALVDEAFIQLRTGRPRPVEIEVPHDTLFERDDVTLLPAAPQRPRPAGNPELLEQAAKLLGEAKSPAIYAGGGISRAAANAELLALAELLEAPVVVTGNGRGAISDRHYLAQGSLADKQIFQSSDVILAVGTRFGAQMESFRVASPGQTIIQIDIDEEEIGRNVKIDLPIVADVKAALADLANRVVRHNRARPSRKDEFEAMRAAINARLSNVHPQFELGAAIRAELPDNGILVTEMTQLGYWSNVAFPVYEPNTYLTPGYQGTLGCGFCISLGAKVGRPDTPVVSINGDGGFGFTMNELATQAQHNIASVTIVFNDNAYGNVRRMQVHDYDNRIIASDLVNPDFVKLAEAFGVTGRRANNANELRTQLREGIKANEPTLIEVPVEEMPNPWKVLGLR
jgi:acetolactate synthase-1/2/3 large subunit